MWLNPSQMGASDVVVIYHYFFARVTVIVIFLGDDPTTGFYDAT